MIPELRAFDVQIVRHKLRHPALRQFCACLYACRNKLGDFAASEDWRRFARPLWSFHRFATAVPLPLSSAALLSAAARATIEEETQRLRRIDASAHETAAQLSELLLACTRSDIDPFGDALRAVLEVRTRCAILVPYDDESVLSALEAAVTIPPSFRLLLPNQAREHADCMREGFSLIVAGKLGNVHPAHLRAPRADISVDVLLYEWASDTTAQALAGPVLGDLAAGGASAPQYTRITEVSGGFSTPAGPATEDHTDDRSELVETRPFVLPELDLLELLPAGHSGSDESTEPVLAISLVLQGNEREQLAVLVEPDEPLTILRFSKGGLSPTEVRAADVVSGDLLVDRVGTADHKLIEQMADDMLAREGHREQLMALQRLWKELLTNQVKAAGIAEVARAIAERCEGWRPGRDRIAEWMRPDTIGPQQKQAFRAACRFLEISEIGAKEHWRAMRAIQNARIAAGKDLSQRMLERIVEECRRGSIKLEEPTAIAFGELTSTVYPVKHLRPGLRTVPRSALGFLFQIDPTTLGQAMDEETSWRE